MGKAPSELFELEKWERVPVNLDMMPNLKGRLRSRKDFEKLKKSYDPYNRKRYPRNWKSLVQQWENRDHPLGVQIWPGFFQPLNVSDSPTLKDLILLTYRDPELVEEMTQFIADFSIRTVERALSDLQIDFALLSEPIASNSGPVVSPSIFERFVIPCYEKVIGHLSDYGIDIFILQTIANVKKLIPSCVKAGVNVLSCGGTKLAGIDYVSIRKEFGKNLALIGGIDARVLTKDKKAIEAEIMSKVPYLISSGGYVPIVDDRIREYVPFENYAHYRNLIAELATM